MKENGWKKQNWWRRGFLAFVLTGGILATVSACGEKPSVPANAPISDSIDAASLADGNTGVRSVGPVNPDVEASIVTTTAPQPEHKTVSVHLKSVGDNLIHSSIYQQALRRGDGNFYDFTYAYSGVEDLIASADISTINQETIIDPEKQPASYPQFNSPPALGDHMLKIGFDVFSLANNHSMDMYESGLRRCLDYWAAREDAVCVGAYQNQEDMDHIRTMEVNGITLAFVGFTDVSNGLSLPEDSDLRLLFTWDEKMAKERVQKARTLADAVIVNIHWGVEYTHIPTERQAYLAQNLADWGADVIIGHHPHVIQPVKYLENTRGKQTLVMYSLGNFISAQSQAATMLGGLMDYTLTKEWTEYPDDLQATQDSVQISVTAAEFIPLVTHYDGGYSNVRVLSLSDYTPELAAAAGVRRYDGAFGYDYLYKTVNQVIDSSFLSEEVVEWKKALS